MAELQTNSKISLDLSCLGIAEQLLDAHIPFDDGILFDRFAIITDTGSLEDQLRQRLVGEWPSIGMTARGIWGRDAEFQVSLGVFISKRHNSQGSLVLEGHLQHGEIHWPNQSNAAPFQWQFTLVNVKLHFGDHITLRDEANPEHGGQLDSIDFEIGGRRWRLTDDLVLQWRKRNDFQVATPIVNGTLATPFVVGDSEELLRRTAQDICDLLSFGLSRTVNWFRYRLLSSDGLPIRGFYRNALTAPFEASGLIPVDNRGQFVLKGYVESGYAAMQAAHPWFSRTLKMCAEAQIARYLDVRCALLFAVLDRITSFVVERNGTAEIDEELSKKLKDRSAVAKIQATMREISEHWTQEHTDSIVSQIKLWNRQPSYAGKIERACKQLRVPAPTKELLRSRNSMLHDLELDVPDDSTYYERFSQLEYVVLCLMLRLLGFDGMFYHTQIGSQPKVFRDLHGPALPEDTCRQGK